MSIYKSITELVGNTPLIRLNKVSDQTGCEILGKAEFLNPGQSIKDRAALSIIQSAVNDGSLKPGGTIVEGTAGNTGIGLSMIGSTLGYRCVIVIPETQTKEKKDSIKIAGGELIEIPAAPYKNPNNYVRFSGRLADALAQSEPNGAIWANQFDNTANRQAHIDGTGLEIWQQTEGQVDGFICACGSGGTLAGVATSLRSFKPDVKIGIADPHGAALYEYFKNGELKSEGSSITEGIGQGRITGNLEGLSVDLAYRISDQDALPYIFDLMQNEGLALGTSSAINIAGAVEMAKELGPGHTIVTVLCDYAHRYQSKMFNLELLRRNDLPLPKFMADNHQRSAIDISKIMEPVE